MSIQKDINTIKNLLCFAEVAKNGQIKETANANNMKQSNLSNIIKDLESQLKLKVFNRSHSGVSLTESGKNLFEIACDIENILYRVRNFANISHKISGNIRLWTSDGIGSDFIATYLPEFYQRYPDVHIDIQSSLCSPKFIQEIDMGIVYQEPTFKDAVVITQNQLLFKLYASKSYLTTYGYPKDLKDLTQNHKICTRQNFRLWPAWNTVLSEAQHVVATTNSSAILLSMVKRGIGLSMIPVCAAEKDPELVPLDRLELNISHPFWIISHKDTKDIPKVRALINYLVEATKKL